MIERYTLFADILILAWLVGTWFYEGHHMRCKIRVVCPHCSLQHNHECLADERNQK